MHHDPTSARDLAKNTSIWQAVIWVVVFVLVAFVLALALRNKDAQRKIEELEEDTDLLNKRVSACERLHDDMTDLEKRVTGVEAQFWE
jgi:phosphotransferase system  glucose/maltose/N-acetylglucosamine-specific IIC component